MNGEQSDGRVSASERYRKQVAFAGWSQNAQERWRKATVLIVGCGAVGTAQANLLARSGIGRLMLVDRDFVDWSNLQRQTLFTEADVLDVLPKVIAAQQHLQAINRDVAVEPIVAEANGKTIGDWVDQADLVLDGTDNFETRFLLNEACCRAAKPWIYGGCLGAAGQVQTIVPGQTACLACLMPDGPPAPGSLPTCDQGGILASIVQIIASLQVNEAMKLLGLGLDQANRSLTVVDCWEPRFRTLNLESLAKKGCAVCREGRYRWLNGEIGTQAHVLCGRNAIQLRVPLEQAWDLALLAERLQPHGELTLNRYLVRVTNERFTLTLFPEGRVIVAGTEDVALAKTWLRQAIGQ